MRKIIFIITSASIVLLIFLIFLLTWSASSRRPTQTIVIPTQIPLTPVRLPGLPPSTNKIPVVGPHEVNTAAPETQASIREVQKLENVLPYNLSFTSSTGAPVTIFIPGKTLQTRDWVLKTEITGINFQADPSSQEYASMKQSFREAAKNVFDFLDKNGVNTKNIFVTWGDRAYEQETAEKWLQNK